MKPLRLAIPVLAWLACTGCHQQTPATSSSSAAVPAGASASAPLEAGRAGTSSAGASGTTPTPDPRFADGGPLAHHTGPVGCGTIGACPDPALDIPADYFPDGFVAPWPCCADAAANRCGFTKGEGCIAVQLDARCPTVVIPLNPPYAGCCTEQGTCGIDFSALGKPEFACYDLAVVPTLGLVADPPAPRHCDGTPIAVASVDNDAGL
jgi:hypothetical protein